VPSRYSIGAATVVMLVVLRLCIGWHFFSEGVKHYADPNWTSEGVLRSAKGPLAPLYHSYIDDFHGFERLLHNDTTQAPDHAIKAWLDEIQADWDEYRQRFAIHYSLDDVQQKRASAVLHDYQAELRSWAAENKDALATHVHEWRRKETTRATPAAGLPFQRKRTSEKQLALAGEAKSWKAELTGLERKYEESLEEAVGADQAMPRRATSLEIVDVTMTYGILAIGLLLLLGLFTRVACVAGAVFLLSVVMMQPFWVSEALPTFNQYVEMLALLTLATTPVGRWAGLDFFLAQIVSRPCCSSKGKTDVSES
jgi:uncharacterized membrane protein YphA (DoxX/SURF4 family)